MENKIEKNEVVTYDYKTVRVKREMETMTIDSYENLRWEFVGSSISYGGTALWVNLSFKRDRKIDGKQSLLRLQERVDASLANIETLKAKKSKAGFIAAMSTGIGGALVFGGGISMILVGGTTPIGWLIGGIILGVVGAVICAAAYPMNKKLRQNATASIDPRLEEEYNRLSDTCEEAR